MCGIFGYISQSTNNDGDAATNILNGLKRLEYRGYDSWGVAVVKENKIDVAKKVGAIGTLDDLKNLPKSHIGIGHTRWATHGGVTHANAHPHYSSDKTFVLAQNGIVENYQELKQMLIKKGYTFETQTDTEVIVRLVEDKLKSSSEKNDQELHQAVREAFLELKGRNTIIVLSSTEDHIIAVRNGSPLVIGMGKHEYFFASDTFSFADKTNKVVFMNDFEMVEYKKGTVKLFDVRTNNPLQMDIQKLDHTDISIDKGGHEHFMLKEILEQKHTIREAVSYAEEEFDRLVVAIKKAKMVFTIGAGGAFYSADQVAYFLRSIAGIKALGIRPYEIESYEQLMQKGDVVIAISQSGETADTIEALNIAKAKGLKIASAVNMVGSTITRMSDFPFFSRSGPEMCVLSTKSGSAQVAFGYILSLTLYCDAE